jgi:hypothetical protein
MYARIIPGLILQDKMEETIGIKDLIVLNGLSNGLRMTDVIKILS